LNNLRAHHGDVDMKQSRHGPAFALCLLSLLCGTAGCVYDYPEPLEPTASGPPVTPTAGSRSQTATLEPYSDPQILEQEAQNYAELYRLLRASPGPVLLFEVGPLDGPVRGFGATAAVPASGQYTVTAACVGASGAKVSVGQEHPGAPFRPVELALACTGSTSEVMTLQQGSVFAHLVLPGPGDTPWTGAVGGVRVTAAG
jgi:hypothetical protein